MSHENDLIITLSVNNGKVCVWNSEDWLKLRLTHRIVGELIGCLAHLPRQEAIQGLPLSLLPEEVTLLVERKIARLVYFPDLLKVPGVAITEEFTKYREKLSKDQGQSYMESRKQLVTSMIDKIVAGKRKKLLGIKNNKRKNVGTAEKYLPDIELQLNKDQILEEELSKIKPADDNNPMVQIFTQHPWLKEGDEKDCAWRFPETAAENLRYHAFRNLWDQGHYITSGHKFGVDFLVYPGDPIKFHAQFLVVCIDRKFQIPILDLVALGRLGTSVRKTVVLASQHETDDNAVVFQSLTWDGTSRF